ncbi:MAG: hypothetical protein ACRCZJ_05535, partial [Erysipelotrichaceae bacterium]
MSTKKIQWFFASLFMLGMFFFSNINAKAETLNLGGQRQSIYEVTEASISNGNLILKGWMFVDRQQHYQNKSNYSYQLLIGNNTYHDLKNHNVNMTDYFDIAGVTAWCSEPNPPNYTSNTCNMRYDNVGFSFSIPLSAITNTVIPELQLTDKWGNKHKHQIKFAKDLATTTVGDYQYRFNSSLSNARFTTTHTSVIVRQNPSSSSSWWGGGSSGVTTNGSPNANWLLGMEFSTIYETRVVGGVTWYRPRIGFSWRTHSSVTGNRWFAMPGTDTKTAWIPSTF